MKKSLTFIFAAALLVSCQQEENEATTPANSRITITLRPEIKSVLQSPKTVTSYMQRINR